MPARTPKNKPEVDEDLEFQKREWRVERIGWIAMAAVVLVSLLGLFGDGPLSRVDQTYADGFRLEYDRFGRYFSPEEILITLPASSIQDGQASFWIESKFLERIQKEAISPEPEQTIAEPDRLIYVFEVGETPRAIRVKMDIRPQGRGLNEGRIGWGQGNEASLIQFVYP